jgi:hypothetical protein
MKKILTIALPVLFLFGVLLSVSAHAATGFGFANKSPAFPAPGAGDPQREYTFIIPEGCFLETPSGEIINAGETIGLPGNLVRLMDPDEGGQIISTGRGFNSRSDFANIEPSQRGELGVIELTLPEGAKLSHQDGTTIVGPRTVTVMVTATTMTTSEESPVGMRKYPSGFQSK